MSDLERGQRSHLVDGAQDLAGFLVQGVRAPVGVELLQLSDQPVVLTQEECVQRDHPQVFVCSGITCTIDVSNENKVDILTYINKLTYETSTELMFSLKHQF